MTCRARMSSIAVEGSTDLEKILLAETAMQLLYADAKLLYFQVTEESTVPSISHISSVSDLNILGCNSLGPGDLKTFNLST